jgi:hypothetical protein
MTAPRPKTAIGEHWYVKFAHRPRVLRVTITDLTERTVALCTDRGAAGRYRICDVKFVERITTRAARDPREPPAVKAAM